MHRYKPILTAACFIALSAIGCARSATLSKAPRCCPVIELRQYVTRLGKRDELIQLYEQHFMESQEVTGIMLPGQFRVIGNPDRFDWLQGFASMADRLKSFNAFYHGQTWRKYRGRVNSILLDNDNVLLLQPAHSGSGFAIPERRTAGGGTTQATRGLVVVTIYYLGLNSSSHFDGFFEKSIRPIEQDHGARIIGTFVTDHSPNNFPALPLRTDVNVFVWFACYADQAAYERAQKALEVYPGWARVQDDFSLAKMYIAPEVHLLVPTPRSALRCSATGPSFPLR